MNWRTLLVSLLAVTCLCSMFFSIVFVLETVRNLLRIDANLYAMALLLIATASFYRKVRYVWVVSAVFNYMAYVAHARHNEHAHHVLDSLSNIVLLFWWLDGNGWWKKLWGKIRSAALTAVNAASFNRQTKEAFSCAST